MTAKTKPNGGPAFPMPSGYAVELGSTEWNHAQFGMSLRDYFAAAVIGHLVIAENRQEFDLAADASFAYKAADAMLKARLA